MANPRVAHCIFADDIRFEVGNKWSLMGIYGTDINFVGPPPFLMAKFAFAIFLIYDVDDTPTRIKIRINVPGVSDPVFAQDYPMENIALQQAEGINKAKIQIPVGLGNVVLPELGVVEVFVETELGEMRAGLLRVLTTIPSQETISSSES